MTGLRRTQRPPIWSPDAKSPDVGGAVQPDAERSDTVMRTIERALSDDAASDARNVLVMVSGDEILLRGHIRSWSERSRIGEVAWNTAGVRTVHNDLVLYDDAGISGRLHRSFDASDAGAGGCDV
ncbi:BON domain-containing protein [Curtobacterium sp. PhB115]|uniref:BON domain-containing protein n=1 Tax=Curtobacterium sp. PhB115 TaxID=2485173 RepID=UPI000F4B3A9F|nr:BON domain-containing protein [Curtobacterium sp. PhB115]